MDETTGANEFVLNANRWSVENLSKVHVLGITKILGEGKEERKAAPLCGFGKSSPVCFCTMPRGNGQCNNITYHRNCLFVFFR